MVLVKARNLPQHVGVIMDGNGRWAQQRGLPREAGHREGAKTVRRIVQASRRLGIRALTLYAFSEQNWSRPDGEVDALWVLLREFLESERGEILQKGIRLDTIGNVGRLPALVKNLLEPLRKESEGNEAMTLTLALSYGGREEIAIAARDLAKRAQQGTLNPDDITPELLHSCMPSLTVGDPDLIIRTGGDRRISNFLLYGLAYAELHFTGALWPDFTNDDLFEAIASYQGRERRYGQVGAGVPCVASHQPPDAVATLPTESEPESQDSVIRLAAG